MAKIVIEDVTGGPGPRHYTRTLYYTENGNRVVKDGGEWWYIEADQGRWVIGSRAYPEKVTKTKPNRAGRKVHVGKDGVGRVKYTRTDAERQRIFNRTGLTPSRSYWDVPKRKGKTKPNRAGRSNPRKLHRNSTTLHNLASVKITRNRDGTVGIVARRNAAKPRHARLGKGNAARRNAGKKSALW